MSKALVDIGEGLGGKVWVEKTKWCSGIGEIAADSLSKGDWDEAWQSMPDKNEDPGKLPVSLLHWITNPLLDMNLGKKVMSDMSKYTKVLHLD